MKYTGRRFYDFLTGLNPDFNLPDKIAFINCYTSIEVKEVLSRFCEKYYSSNNKRVLILGINPGRFGSGITGIPFTDPVALESDCGIINSFDKRRELSSHFVYDVIRNYGTTSTFFNNFLLSAVCPIGFLNGTKNYNYYDSGLLLQASHDFIENSLILHSKMNVSTEVVIALEKKRSVLEAFNNKLKLFGKIMVLNHPRYIMQYKLKDADRYIGEYCNVLNNFSAL
ncbi:MAG: DUF4918 family protein [Bacteroidetes bacterium]|nr:DUF4918 family protein [Bacteroidota bacterium]